jgi:hypothetical protein
MSVPPRLFRSGKGDLAPAYAVTHGHYAHLVLESASPCKHGGSHLKQECSKEARTVEGGYGR